MNKKSCLIVLRFIYGGFLFVCVFHFFLLLDEKKDIL